MSSSSPSTTPEDSSTDTSRTSDESVPAQQPDGRKPRGSVTPQLVTSLVQAVNESESPNLKQIALAHGVSLSTVYRVLQKIRSGELVHDNRVVMPAKVEGRRMAHNSRTAAIVEELLTTGSPKTLEMARAQLDEMGTRISISTIWLIAKELGLKHKQITTRPAVVFDPVTAGRRFDYAQQVNQIHDQELWFRDESRFNLHIAPLRRWARR